MAYATITQLQGLLAKFTLSTTTTPTTAQATEILSQVSQEVDVALASKGVAPPVASPSYFVDWLEHVNCYGAAAQVLKSAFPGSRGQAEEPAYAYWQKLYDQSMKGIKDGSMLPPGLTANDSYVAPSTYFTRNQDEEEDLGDISEPLFKTGMVF